jgi:two-component system phosphate regulon response regulator PhoB
LKQVDVVVIEDEDMVRELLLLDLEDAGFSAIGFSSARTALKRFENGLSAGLILLDLRMPDMTGEEFCEERKKRPKLCGIPVCIVSASPGLEAVRRKCNAQEAMSKPVRFQDLAQTVQRLLGYDSCADVPNGS